MSLPKCFPALLAVVILLSGVALRSVPSVPDRRPGLDEVFYRNYVDQLTVDGLASYPTLSASWLEKQRQPETLVELPPTRVLYIFSGWLWRSVEFHGATPVDLRDPGVYDRDPSFLSLRHVSAFFSCLLLLLSGVAAWRWRGAWFGLAVLTLMAFAPLEIEMSQRALIDGYFAFWAGLTLWLLWENLRAERGRLGWRVALALALAGLALTKENAFFVCFALAGLLVTNRWARFGRLDWTLLGSVLAGLAAAAVVLMVASGGVGPCVEIYRLLVTKAPRIPYSIMTQDGPWFRYLVDMLVVSPWIVILGLGALFTVCRTDRLALYLGVFMVLSYLAMCEVRYGLNLRFATIWDFPLRVLVIMQLQQLAGVGSTVMGGMVRRGQNIRLASVAAAVLALGVYDLFQYLFFFVHHRLYDPVSAVLLNAVDMVK